MPNTIKKVRNFIANAISDNNLATVAQMDPELVNTMICANFMNNVNANYSVSDAEHMAMCIKLMRRTENESPNKVIWFSLTTADIILRALILPNLIPHSFLRELPTGDISVRNITSE